LNFERRTAAFALGFAAFVVKRRKNGRRPLPRASGAYQMYHRVCKSLHFTKIPPVFLGRMKKRQ